MEGETPLCVTVSITLPLYEDVTFSYFSAKKLQSKDRFSIEQIQIYLATQRPRAALNIWMSTYNLVGPNSFHA